MMVTLLLLLLWIPVSIDKLMDFGAFRSGILWVSTLSAVMALTRLGTAPCRKGLVQRKVANRRRYPRKFALFRRSLALRSPG